MRLSLIAAMDRNAVIGDDHGLPWRLPADLRRFRRLTMGKPIILGRKTLALIGKPLPGRDNVVLTRSRAPIEGCHVVHDADAALALGRSLAQQRGADEIMVIGGGEVYRQFLASADRVYLTLVEGAFAGDVTFPVEQLRTLPWRLAEEQHVAADADNSHAHRFLVLDRDLASSYDDAGNTARNVVPL